MMAGKQMDMERVRAFLAEKEERRDKDLDQRFETARRDFQRIIAHIVDRYSPTRIYQWGSLLDRTRFSAISDIDIALEGLAGPAEYFAILGDAAGMSDLPVDVIELEKVPPATAEAIRSEGRLVHERSRKS
jgi:predicted nucleotidyltransferase